MRGTQPTQVIPQTPKAKVRLSRGEHFKCHRWKVVERDSHVPRGVAQSWTLLRHPESARSLVSAPWGQSVSIMNECVELT